jgi:hypothetical protein
MPALECFSLFCDAVTKFKRLVIYKEQTSISSQFWRLVSPGALASGESLLMTFFYSRRTKIKQESRRGFNLPFHEEYAL